MGALAQAFIQYAIKIVMFTAIAAVGIFAGIKARKSKNKKQQADN